MSGPVAVDLTALAERVGDPDLAAAAAARMRLQADGLLTQTGRLGELAVWWAGVRGADRAGPPRRVLSLSPAQPSTDGCDQDVAAAIAWGVDQVDRAVDGGADLVLLAVDDDAAARLGAAAMLELDPVEAAGWPTERGIDDETWMHEVVSLRDGLRRLAAGPAQTAPVLTGVGSAALAAGCAVALAAAARRTAVLLDGAGASVGALLARRAAYPANQWWRLAHAGPGEVYRQVADSMNLTALVDLDLRVQDGTGARLGRAVVEEAARLLDTAPGDRDVDDAG